MKFLHDWRNINIHLVNFCQFFLTSFFNYPAAILGWKWHGPHFKTKSHRCPKIGTCVPYTILKWAIRLLFLVLQNKYFFANFYVCLIKKKCRRPPPISIFCQNIKHFPKTDQYTLPRISWRWCMRSFKPFLITYRAPHWYIIQTIWDNFPIIFSPSETWTHPPTSIVISDFRIFFTFLG